MKNSEPKRSVLKNHATCTPSSDQSSINNTNQCSIDIAYHNENDSHINLESPPLDSYLDSVNTGNSDTGAPVVDNEYMNSLIASAELYAPDDNHAERDSKTTIINQAYLGDKLKTALSRCRALLVDSIQGTGKTTAIKQVISGKALMITPREKLNRAVASELDGFSYYGDIKQAIKSGGDSELIVSMIERMTCTPQSLPALAKYYKSKTGNDLAFDLIVFDEITATAEMTTANISGDKVEIMQTLKEVARNSDKCVGLDAFPSTGARFLLSTLSPDSLVDELKNEHKRWDNITAHILHRLPTDKDRAKWQKEGKAEKSDASSYQQRVDTLSRLQNEAIKKGENIAITSSTATYCETQYEALKALHPNLRIILINSKESQEATALMNTPSLLSNYQVVIFTPAISVGVSFDLPNHINSVFASFPNVDGTGGTADAVQALARIRHPSKNEWFIALDEQRQLFSKDREKITSQQVIEILEKRIKQEYFGAGKTDGVTETEEQILKLWAINSNDRVADKNHYNDKLKSKLIRMGANIQGFCIDSVGADDELANVTGEVKEAKKAREVEIKTKSERIDERQYNYIAMRLKHDKASVTEDERGSVARYRFESKFNINCDELTENELDSFLDLDSKNAISHVVNNEIANYSTTEFNNRLMAARVTGLGENEAFKVDLLDDKLTYRLRARLLSYALPYFEGESYSHKSLTKSPLSRFIKKHHDEILITQVIPLPSNWQKKPALVMSHLLKMCGYKTTQERVLAPNTGRDKGKKIQAWRAIAIPEIREIIKDRLERGENWVHKTTTLMDVFSDVDVFLSPEDATELQMPRIDIELVARCLKIIPSHLKSGILSEYLSMYDMMNPENQGIEAPAIANDWLEKQAVLSDEKIANL
jgi:hypothetical protein